MKVISYKNVQHYITILVLPYIKYIIYYLNQVLSNHKCYTWNNFHFQVTLVPSSFPIRDRSSRDNFEKNMCTPY